MRIFPIIKKIINSATGGGGARPYELITPPGCGHRRGTVIGTPPPVVVASPFHQLADATANGLTLTQVGTGTPRLATHSKYGSGIDLGNSTANLLKSTNALLRSTGNLAITLSFELDAMPGATRGFLVGHGNQDNLNDTTNINYLIALTSDGKVQFVQEKSVGVFDEFSSAAGVLTTGAHTLTVLRNDTAKTIVVKLDGVIVINTSYTGSILGGTAGWFTLGNADHSSPGPLDVSINECRVWTSNIPAQSTLDTIADPNSATFKETPEGTETACWFMGMGKAIQFDGSTAGENSQGVMIGDVSLAGLTACCVECRFQISTLTTANPYKALVAKSLPGTHFYLGINPNNKLYCHLTVGSILELNGNLTLVVGTRYAASLDYDGTRLRLWLRNLDTGVTTLEDSIAVSGAITDPSTVASAFIGRRGWISTSNFPEPFSGIIDEVRISNISRYSSSFNPPSTPYTCDGSTLRLYHLDEITTEQGARSETANVLAHQRAGIDLKELIKAIVPVKPAIRLNPVATLKTAVKPAIRLATIVQGVIKPPLKAAVRLIPVARLTVPVRAGARLVLAPIRGLVLTRPAFRVQFQFNLNHENHVQPGTATQDTGGAWQNVANSEGTPNGVYATLTEGVALVTGTLRGQFAAQSSRPSTLAITQVLIDFYFQTADFPTVGTTWTVGFRHGGVGGASVTLRGPESSNVNHLITPLTFDITSEFGGGGEPALSWANIAAIQPFYSGSILVNSTLTPVIRVDGTRLRVVAAETWNP
jgi:hypothetical protein